MRLRIVLLAMALCVFLNCKERIEVGVVAQEMPPVIEKKAKTAALYTDLDGKAVALKDFKGKRILLNYWATWCRPCIAEMPSLMRATEILEKENYVVLLASDQTLDKIKKFIEKRDFDFNYIKYNGSLATLQINALPTTHIYNENGKKVEKIIGMVVWDSPEMIAKLKAIH